MKHETTKAMVRNQRVTKESPTLLTGTPPCVSPPEGRGVQLRQAAAVRQALQQHVVHRNLALELFADCSKKCDARSEI